MKKNELTKLRSKKINELKKLAQDKKSELAKITAERKAVKKKKLKEAKNLRHDIAQMLTIIREKEIAENLERAGQVNEKKEKKIIKNNKAK